MTARLRVPPTARPHEVAILLCYAELRSVKATADRLHYRAVQPVYRVIRKYSSLFVQVGIHS